MAARDVSSMLFRARLAPAGSLSISSAATAAWIVDAVRVWPIESCNSCASRFRCANRFTRSSAAASRSPGPWPRSTDASRRSSTAPPRVTPAASTRHPTAGSNAHAPRQPSPIHRDSPKTVMRSAPPSQTEGNATAPNTARHETAVTTPPSTMCGTSHITVRSRLPQRGPVMSTGAGRPAPSSALASRTLARLADRGAPMATVTTANAHTKPSTRRPAGRLGGANSSAAVSGGRLKAAPNAAYTQSRNPVPHESGRINLCTVGPYPGATSDRLPRKRQNAPRNRGNRHSLSTAMRTRPARCESWKASAEVIGDGHKKSSTEPPPRTHPEHG